MRGGAVASSDAGGEGDSTMSVRSATTTTPSSSSFKHQVYLAVGSNLGDRFLNIQKALSLLCHSNNNNENSSSCAAPRIRLVQTSFLHETAPMYVTDQPRFLNGAVQLETDLEPQALLKRCKQVERILGRDFQTIRNGPRPIDLDILLYYDYCDHHPTRDDNDAATSRILVQDYVDKDDLPLILPHPRIQERMFVLQPLLEVAPPDLVHPVLKVTLHELYQRLQEELQTKTAEPETIRVLPLPRNRMLYFKETIVMGVLNVTPDSFSDGGRWNQSVKEAIQRALAMAQEGANIIDIGGESTRPGAQEVTPHEEIQRVVPVIEGIRKGTLLFRISRFTRSIVPTQGSGPNSCTFF